MSSYSQNIRDAKSDVKFLKGQVMHVSGIPTENVKYATLENFFNNYVPDANNIDGNIYLSFKRASSDVYLQFHTAEENAALNSLEKMNEDAKKNDGKIRLHGQEIKCRILEGEEEKQFWYNIENMPANKNCRNKRYIRLGVGCRDTAAAKLAEYASQKLMEKNEARKNIANAKFLKGQILYVTELPTTFVNFGLLKDFFNEYVPVAYADYEQGSSEAFIRFRPKKVNTAVRALEEMKEDAKNNNGKILFYGHEIKCRVLEGEEEERFWDDCFKKREKHVLFLYLWE
uniref:XRRM domain-containing protein n=1 Tax=Panagrolaimus sp. ES5 TaxID=591445 RepID=A0AC34GXY4_9BILA